MTYDPQSNIKVPETKAEVEKVPETKALIEKVPETKAMKQVISQKLETGDIEILLYIEMDNDGNTNVSVFKGKKGLTVKRDIKGTPKVNPGEGGAN
jgi:hypothetical protein